MFISMSSASVPILCAEDEPESCGQVQTARFREISSALPGDFELDLN